jgi:hypothetical protein
MYSNKSSAVSNHHYNQQSATITIHLNNVVGYCRVIVSNLLCYITPAHGALLIKLCQNQLTACRWPSMLLWLQCQMTGFHLVAFRNPGVSCLDIQAQMKCLTNVYHNMHLPQEGQTQS